MVVCGSWWLCGGCVCESRDVSKDAIICQSTNDFSRPRLTLVQSTITVIVHHIDSPHVTVPTTLISHGCP